ncbi:MAG: outer membrane protein assembly factor BamD [Tistrella sp.]|uniref:Outer membrane protein assembly factor BamD n=2 Tax=Tistrella TaxID=171436 RepID=A0A3B9IL89_9PROT|nr:outer membrane protein assembly factor BamD [Tistrella sp.]MBA78696.1 outer membrane protein assembly factor BamD [Tistrella sp.]HAE48634.1 outer membrane protein assembly factor BamD [Tistrella mobilis]
MRTVTAVTRTYRILRAGLLAACVAALAACSSDDDDRPAYVERPVEQIYAQAANELDQGEYRKAAQSFDEVERQHPYSTWATEAQLMAAYSYYQANQYEDAIATAQRFIDLHPGNPNVAYAYYLVGLCHYERISDVGRDQEMTRKSLEAFQEVVRRFPDSAYAPDARLKIDLARDHLAGKEMEIGRYYLTRGLYIAAINRFRTVIERYQTTTHVPEALHRLVEAYLSLGIEREAQTAAAVLGYNYPGSDWYEDSYALLTGRNLQPVEDKGSWISRAFRSVF